LTYRVHKQDNGRIRFLSKERDTEFGIQQFLGSGPGPFRKERYWHPCVQVLYCLFVAEKSFLFLRIQIHPVILNHQPQCLLSKSSFFAIKLMALGRNAAPAAGGSA
jgi:hypothetical protein